MILAFIGVLSFGVGVYCADLIKAAVAKVKSLFVKAV